VIIINTYLNSERLTILKTRNSQNHFIQIIDRITIQYCRLTVAPHPLAFNGNAVCANWCLILTVN